MLRIHREIQDFSIVISLRDVPTLRYGPGGARDAAAEPEAEAEARKGREERDRPASGEDRTAREGGPQAVRHVLPILHCKQFFQEF